MYLFLFISVYTWRRASEHQFEVKSAETEFIEGQREHERSRTLQNETHWRTNRFRVMYFIAQHVHNGSLTEQAGCRWAGPARTFRRTRQSPGRQHSQSKRTDAFSLSFGHSLSPLSCSKSKLILLHSNAAPAAPPNWA